MNRTTAFLAAIAFCVVGPAYAEYSVSNEGTWPKSWPKELEPLRNRSRTFDGGGMPAVVIYEIPFTKQAEFESAWPHIVKLKSKGASLTLLRGRQLQPEYQVGTPISAGIRIFCPSPQPGPAFQIELFVDGDIVDLNRVPLPADTPIIDKRFKDGNAGGTEKELKTKDRKTEREPTGHHSPASPAEAVKKADPVLVNGRVLYHDSTPAANASVFLVGDVSTTIGDGKAWQGLRSDATEDKTIPKATTDFAGRFTLSGRGDAKRIVVSSPRLDFWVVPTPKDAAAKDSEFTIKLPAPGRLVVKYDIPGGDAKAKLFLQVDTWDSPLSSGIQYTRGPLVANKGQVVLDNLPPGKCYLDREKNIAWGTHFCDRRLLTIESSKTLESNFVRDRGTAVVGRVVGLQKEMRAAVSGTPDSAGVLVSVRSPEAKGDFVSDIELPLFDVLRCGLDGRFKTEQLLPGKYAILVEAWLPEKPEEMSSSGIRRSSFIGRAVVTVPENGQPLQVMVELKPRENTPPGSAFSKTKEPAKTLAIDLGGGVKLEMVLIPAGEYLMGSPESDKDAWDGEKPQHRVRITKPFYLGKYLVTQEQWEAVLGNTASHAARLCSPRWRQIIEVAGRWVPCSGRRDGDPLAIQIQLEELITWLDKQ